MSAREVMSVDEALFYADAWGAQEDSLGHSDLAFKALAAEVRSLREQNHRLRAPAAFDMDAAVEAVCAVWNLHAPDARRIITAALPHLMPDMEALRRALKPFAELTAPAKTMGNVGFYSIRFDDIREARAALAQRDTSEGGG